MAKLIVVVGATGNQGGSVARRFAQDPAYKVRGLCRNPSSDAAKKLAAEGVEVVAADLDDVDTLKKAFECANLIFSVTNYWEPFFRPDCRQEAQELGVSCRRYAYDVEYRQGRNIADAAATVADSLVDNGLLVSSLSHAGKCTNGKQKELYHFDAKAEVFPFYVQDKHPELAKKMSCIHTGYFMTSYLFATAAYFVKDDEGKFFTNFCTDPNKATFHLDVQTDTGPFVYAVSQRPPGGNYMAAGTTCSWSDWMKTWLKHTNKEGGYRQVSMQQMMDDSPDREFGREVAEMFIYTSDPGYDGGMKLITAEDMRKEGIDCPMTSWEEYCRKTDFSPVFSK